MTGPTVTPVTEPVASTVAFDELLDQVPPVEVFVSATVVPKQTAAGPEIGFGVAFTVAEVVYVLVHPAPVPLFTFSTYVPVAAVVAPVTDADAAVAPVIDAGPVHEYPVTLVAPVAFNVSVFPEHIGELAVIPDIEGAALIVIVVIELHEEPVE